MSTGRIGGTTEMSEYNGGDRVRIERDGEAHEGVVTVEHGTGYICQGRYDLPWRVGAGWTLTVLEKAPPPLPTEPGWYLDRWGGDVYLGLDGSWVTALKFGAPVSDVQARAPLTRLGPVPVTVQKVLEAINRIYGLSDGPKPREPQFAPEGEPDEYRDAFARIDNPGDDWQPSWMLQVHAPKGNAAFDVERGRIRHILAYLSEQERGVR